MKSEEDGRRLKRGPPAPIEPLRSGPPNLSGGRVVTTADWSKWVHMRQVELWQAVALTLGYEPEDLPVYLAADPMLGDDPFKLCPADFRTRLEISNSNAGTSFYVEATGRLRARSLVDLRTFARWALGVWSKLPAELSGLGAPVTTAAARSEQASWFLRKPERNHGYTHPLYLILKAAHDAGRPKPTPREVLDAWRERQPLEVAGFQSDGVSYYDRQGNTKAASLGDIADAIERLTKPRTAR